MNLKKHLFGFWSDRRGVSAVEMAISAPVLAMFMFGATEVTMLIRADMKLDEATASLANMVAEQISVSSSQISTLCQGAAVIMSPYSTKNFKATVASATNNSASGKSFTVNWNQPCGAGSPLVSGTALSAMGTFLPFSDDSVIVVNASYSYQSIVNMFFKTPITLTSTKYMRPRTDSTITCSNCE